MPAVRLPPLPTSAQTPGAHAKLHGLLRGANQQHQARVACTHRNRWPASAAAMGVLPCTVLGLFRPKTNLNNKSKERRVEKHFLATNLVIAKTFAYNIPIWLISLDFVFFTRLFANSYRGPSAESSRAE